MVVRYHRLFKKQLKRLPLKQQKVLSERLRIFAQDVFHPQLNNRALHGEYAGCRSINISGDLRTVYSCEEDGSFLFIAIGSHSQLYG